MFQSDDEITFDADFLSDTLDVASTTTSVECAKRHSAEAEPQVVKKTGSSSQNTLEILSLLKSKAEDRVENRPEHRFTRPPLPKKKRRVVQRKFPGPAGILPAQRDVNIDLKQLETADILRNDARNDSDEMVCSQQSEDVFSRPAWRRMLQDLGAAPDEAAPGVELPEQYTIAWAKARAARRQLDGGRTPFLAAFVQQIDCSTRNPMAVLKDQTGEIQATLLHEVWEEFGEQLHAGAVVLLRQVGVISTAKQHYLAITLNNLFAIYSDETSGPTPAAGSPAPPKINFMTSGDFIKTLADIRNANKMAAESRDTDYDTRGLDSYAECSKNTDARSNTQNVNSFALFATAEDSQPRRDTPSRAAGLVPSAQEQNEPRRDTPAARRNTQSARVNSFELVPIAEYSCTQPRSENVTRRDTLPRSNTHNRAPGLFSTAEHTLKHSNMAKNTTDSHANSIISETPTFLRPDFDKSTDKTSKSSQESEMLSQVLDGLDAESIFDDF